jgi:Uma2 family endonuclease
MSTGVMTSGELLRLNLADKRTELVRGQLIVREPAGFRHGVVAGRLYSAIERHVFDGRLGVVVAAETGFTLFRNPDTVRAPDVGYVSRARVPHPLPKGFAEMAPDLAVEVLSPDDRPGEVLEKVADWIKAGCRLVWVLDPERRLARVYRADGSEAHITADESLQGEDVLPGFRQPLAEFV